MIWIVRLQFISNKLGVDRLEACEFKSKLNCMRPEGLSSDLGDTM